MLKIIKAANLSIEVNSVTDCIKCANEFLTDDKPDFSVTTTEDDVAYECKKCKSECEYEGIEYPNYSFSELENTAVYRKIAEKIPSFDGYVFHGSAVAVNGKAYLFTAKSGTGKTTHTNLWLKNIDGSYIVNGDKPIIRIIDGEVFVCGTPWMGKERMGCNKCVPLQAVCFLSRGTENEIKKADFKDVVTNFIAQAYRPKSYDALMKTLKLIDYTGNKVGLYSLYCNMNDDAAITAYRGMCND